MSSIFVDFPKWHYNRGHIGETQHSKRGLKLKCVWLEKAVEMNLPTQYTLWLFLISLLLFVKVFSLSPDN